MVTIIEFLVTTVLLLFGWCYFQEQNIKSLKHDVRVLSNLTARYDLYKRLVYEDVVD
jgi:predicted negative regulator of RcsB-dependent stress response